MFALSEFGIGGQAAASLISKNGTTVYIISDNTLSSVSLASKAPKLRWTLDLQPHFTAALTAANTSFLSKILPLGQKELLFLQPCLSTCERYLAVPVKTHNDSRSQIMIFKIVDDKGTQLVCSQNVDGGLLTISAQDGTSNFYAATPTTIISLCLENDVYVLSSPNLKRILSPEPKQKLTIVGAVLMGTTLMLSLSNNSVTIISTKTMSAIKQIPVEGQVCSLFASWDMVANTEQASFLLLSLLGTSKTPESYTCLLYNIKRMKQGDNYHFVVGMFPFPLKIDRYTPDFHILAAAYTSDGMFLNILFTGSESEPFSISIPVTFQHGKQETPSILPIFYDDPAKMDSATIRNKLVLCAHISSTELALAPKVVSKTAASVQIFDQVLIDMIHCTDGTDPDAKADTGSLSYIKRDSQRVIKLSALLILRDTVENTFFCTKSAHAANKLASLSYPVASSVENCHSILTSAKCLRAPENVQISSHIYEAHEFYSPVAIFACLRYNQLYVVLERAITRKEHREHLNSKQPGQANIGVILSNDPDYVYAFNNMRILMDVCLIVTKNAIVLLNRLLSRDDTEPDSETEVLSYLCKFLQPITFAASKIVDTLLKERTMDKDFGADASTVRIVGETASNVLSMLYYLTNIRSFIRTPFPLSRKAAQTFPRVATMLKYTKTGHMFTKVGNTQPLDGSLTAGLPLDSENDTFFNCSLQAYSLMHRSVKRSMAGDGRNAHMLYTPEFGYYDINERMGNRNLDPCDEIPDFAALYSAHSFIGNTAIWSLTLFYSKLPVPDRTMEWKRTRRVHRKMTIMDALRALIHVSVDGTDMGGEDSFVTMDPVTVLLKEAGVHGCRVFIVYSLLVNGESPKACMDACVALCHTESDLRSFIIRAARVDGTDESGLLGCTDEKRSKEIEYYARCIYLAARILFAIDMGYCGPLERDIEDVTLSDEGVYLRQLLQTPGEGDFIGIQLFASETMLSDALRRSLKLLLIHALSYLPYAVEISTGETFYNVSKEDIERSAKHWASRLCHLSLLKGLVSLARPLAMSAIEYFDEQAAPILWPPHPGSARTELIMRSCIMSSIFISIKEPQPGVHAVEHQRSVERAINQQMSRAIYHLRKDLNKIVSNNTSFCSDRRLGVRLCYIFSELATNRYKIERFFEDVQPVTIVSSDVEPSGMQATKVWENVYPLGMSTYACKEDAAKPISTLYIDELGTSGDYSLTQSGFEQLQMSEMGRSTLYGTQRAQKIVPIYCKLINYSPITKVEVSAITAFCLHDRATYPYLLAFLTEHDLRKALQFLRTLLGSGNGSRKLNELMSHISTMKGKIPFCLQPLEDSDDRLMTGSAALSLSMHPDMAAAIHSFSLLPEAHLPYNLTSEAASAHDAYSKGPLNKSFLTYTRLHLDDGEDTDLDAADVLFVPKYEEIESQPVDATQPLFVMKNICKPIPQMNVNPFGNGYIEAMNAPAAQESAPYSPSNLGHFFPVPQENAAQMQIAPRQMRHPMGTNAVANRRLPINVTRTTRFGVGQLNQKPMQQQQQRSELRMPVNPYAAKSTIQNNARARPTFMQKSPSWQFSKTPVAQGMDTKVSHIAQQQFGNVPATSGMQGQVGIPPKSAMKQGSRYSTAAEPVPKKRQTAVKFADTLSTIEGDLNPVGVGGEPTNPAVNTMNIAGNIMMNFQPPAPQPVQAHQQQVQFQASVQQAQAQPRLKKPVSFTVNL